MSTTVTFRCDACDRKALLDSDDGPAPPGWGFVRIEGHALLLCDDCVPPQGRALAISPELCRRLAAHGIRLKACAAIWNIQPAAVPDVRRA